MHEGVYVCEKESNKCVLVSVHSCAPTQFVCVHSVLVSPLQTAQMQVNKPVKSCTAQASKPG